jgi:hypothetical protein
MKLARFLNAGDMVNAEKYYKRSLDFAQQSQDSYTAAIQVFNKNLDQAESLARKIKDTCEFVSGIGLAVFAPPAAVVAAVVVDWLYLGTDYAVDQAYEGTEAANKKLLTNLIVKKLFQTHFEELDGKELGDFIKNRTGKEIFPILENLTKNEQWQRTLSRIIKESGVTLSEGATKQILDSLSNMSFTKKVQ